MNITQIQPRMLILEYRQEESDPDYGYCTWARFTFNLDRYELSISSECGNYGYKWSETPNTESFLHLMSRVEEHYLLLKLNGYPEMFDYEETKNAIYGSLVYTQEDREAFNDFFEGRESLYGEFDSAGALVEAITKEFPELDSSDVWSCVQKDYTGNQKMIVKVFENYIRPYIKNMLKEGK